MVLLDCNCTIFYTISQKKWFRSKANYFSLENLIPALLFPSIPFHFFKVFSKNRRVEGNSNFEITISFHFYINFRNCYSLPFWLLFPSIYHLLEIKGVEGNSNFIIAISFHFLLKWWIPSNPRFSWIFFWRKNQKAHFESEFSSGIKASSTQQTYSKQNKEIIFPPCQVKKNQINKWPVFDLTEETARNLIYL